MHVRKGHRNRTDLKTLFIHLGLGCLVYCNPPVSVVEDDGPEVFGYAPLKRDTRRNHHAHQEYLSQRRLDTHGLQALKQDQHALSASSVSHAIAPGSVPPPNALGCAGAAMGGQPPSYGNNNPCTSPQSLGPFFVVYVKYNNAGTIQYPAKSLYEVKRHLYGPGAPSFADIISFSSWGTVIVNETDFDFCEMTTTSDPNSWGITTAENNIDNDAGCSAYKTLRETERGIQFARTLAILAGSTGAASAWTPGRFSRYRGVFIEWGTFAHELGHNWGISHADAFTSSGTGYYGFEQYADDAIMGYYRASRVPDFTAISRYNLGWIPPSSEIAVYPMFNSSVQLRALNEGPLYDGKYLIVVVPCSMCRTPSYSAGLGGNLWISFRATDAKSIYGVSNTAGPWLEYHDGVPKDNARSITVEDRVHIHFQATGSIQSELWSTLAAGEFYDVDFSSNLRITAHSINVGAGFSSEYAVISVGSSASTNTTSGTTTNTTTTTSTNSTTTTTANVTSSTSSNRTITTSTNSTTTSTTNTTITTTSNRSTIVTTSSSTTINNTHETATTVTTTNGTTTSNTTMAITANVTTTTTRNSTFTTTTNRTITITANATTTATTNVTRATTSNTTATTTTNTSLSSYSLTTRKTSNTTITTTDNTTVTATSNTTAAITTNTTVTTTANITAVVTTNTTVTTSSNTTTTTSTTTTNTSIATTTNSTTTTATTTTSTSTSNTTRTSTTNVTTTTTTTSTSTTNVTTAAGQSVTITTTNVTTTTITTVTTPGTTTITNTTITSNTTSTTTTSTTSTNTTTTTIFQTVTTSIQSSISVVDPTTWLATSTDASIASQHASAVVSAIQNNTAGTGIDNKVTATTVLTEVDVQNEYKNVDSAITDSQFQKALAHSNSLPTSAVTIKTARRLSSNLRYAQASRRLARNIIATTAITQATAGSSTSLISTANSVFQTNSNLTFLVHSLNTVAAVPTSATASLQQPTATVSAQVQTVVVAFQQQSGQALASSNVLSTASQAVGGTAAVQVISVVIITTTTSTTNTTGSTSTTTSTTFPTSKAVFTTSTKPIFTTKAMAPNPASPTTTTQGTVTQAYVSTTLTQIASAGATTIEVASTAGFNIGDQVVVAPGTSQAETNVIVGISSIILQNVLLYTHAAGVTIQVINPFTGTTTTSRTTSTTTMGNTTTTSSTSYVANPIETNSFAAPTLRPAYAMVALLLIAHCGQTLA